MTVSTTCSTANSALILVDVLNDFLAENGSPPWCRRAQLRRHSTRTSAISVWHRQQGVLIGSYGADFYAPLKPRESDIVVGSHHMFDSFNGTGLEEQLRAYGIEKVILAGLTS